MTTIHALFVAIKILDAKCNMLKLYIWAGDYELYVGRTKEKCFEIFSISENLNWYMKTVMNIRILRTYISTYMITRGQYTARHGGGLCK